MLCAKQFARQLDLHMHAVNTKLTLFGNSTKKRPPENSRWPQFDKALRREPAAQAAVITNRW
jgi:hypothetical protein